MALAIRDKKPFRVSRLVWLSRILRFLRRLIAVLKDVRVFVTRNDFEVRVVGSVPAVQDPRDFERAFSQRDANGPFVGLVARVGLDLKYHLAALCLVP